jgi:hypothetical protein
VLRLRVQQKRQQQVLEQVQRQVREQELPLFYRRQRVQQQR